MNLLNGSAMNRYNRLVVCTNTICRGSLFVLLLVLVIGYFFIITDGYLNDTDEIDYRYAMEAFEALQSGNYIDFVGYLSKTEAKPTEAFVRMVFVPIQLFYGKWLGLSMDSYKTLRVFGVQNILIWLSVLLIFAKVLHNLCFKNDFVLVGVFLLGSFVNTGLYLRHILPYNTSLLFLLSAFYIMLCKPECPKTYLFVGFFSALGFSSYPGYFMFIPIILAYPFLVPRSSLIFLINVFVFFSLSFAGVLFAYEIMYRIGGQSYFHDAFVLGGSIDQGSFNEGFTFGVKYLIDVESIAGYVLIGSVFVVVVLAILNKIKIKRAAFIVMVGVFSYLAYGFLVYYVEAFVFYGRIFHMFYPFWVISFLVLLNQFDITKIPFLYKGLWVSLAVLFAYNVTSLKSFAFPRTVIEDYGLGAYSPVIYINELEAAHRYYDYLYFSTSYLPNNNEDVYAVNVCFFQHFPDEFMLTYRKHKLEGECYYRRKHFMSYSAYAYEYCSQSGRAFFADKKFEISIYGQQRED